MEVCWLHEQQEIQRDSKIFQFISEGNIHKLILAEAYPEDSGMYVCEVYNDYGDEDTTCVLTITGTHHCSIVQVLLLKLSMMDSRERAQLTKCHFLSPFLLSVLNVNTELDICL